MRVLVVGGDGYCGWATALHLSAGGHDVAILDSLVRRAWDRELGIASLTPLPVPQRRLDEWRRVSGRSIAFFPDDVTDYEALCRVLEHIQPHAVVHFGQQRSAPFSMMNRDRAVRTHVNNTVGNLNLLWALHERAPETHLIKLGTMGEYGTPNIDIEEGFITIEHKGRTDTLPFPKQPGSFYHLTKVSDSDQIYFACRAWGLRATDLNQGVVYGVQTPQTTLSPPLVNRFDYDDIYGTVLNRFCVEAAVRHPLTVYGKGGQTRAFLDIRDTVRCVELAMLHVPSPGEYRVFNQFTEVFSVGDIAARVCDVARSLGLDPVVEHCENPRVEKESHWYRTANTKLRDLGLQPTLLSDATIMDLIETALRFRDRVDLGRMRPRVAWRTAPLKLDAAANA